VAFVHCHSGHAFLQLVQLVEPFAFVVFFAAHDDDFFWLDIASGNRFVGCKLFKKSRIKNDITPNEQKKRGKVTAKFPKPFWDSLFCLDRRRNLQTSF
jgi:hypothetical protein